jgi:hypothetical protein
MPKACRPQNNTSVNLYDLYEIFTEIMGNCIKCQTYVVGYEVSTYKRTIMTVMIDTHNPLLERLAFEIADLHNVGGIELEQWETAYQFVKHFYNTEEYVQIVIGSKK